MLPSEQWGEPATFERLTVERVHCIKCGASLPRDRPYAIRVNRTTVVRVAKGVKCPRCRHAQVVPQLFGGQEVVEFYQTNCGKPFDPELLVPEAEVRLSLLQRNGAPATFE